MISAPRPHLHQPSDSSLRIKETSLGHRSESRTLSSSPTPNHRIHIPNPPPPSFPSRRSTTNTTAPKSWSSKNDIHSCLGPGRAAVTLETTSLMGGSIFYTKVQNSKTEAPPPKVNDRRFVYLFVCTDREGIVVLGWKSQWIDLLVSVFRFFRQKTCGERKWPAYSVHTHHGALPPTPSTAQHKNSPSPKLLVQNHPN